MAAALILVGLAAVVVVALFGARTMVRDDREKAAVLSTLDGTPVSLRVIYLKLITMVEGTLGPVARGGVALRKPGQTNDEFIPLESIVEIRAGDRVWGPWGANRRTLLRRRS